MNIKTTTKSNSKFHLWMLLVGFISPFIIMSLLQPYYIPAIDESYQLQGAIELASHGHYVSIRDFDHLNLSKPELSYVNAWPIGYSFIIAELMKLGFSLSASAKLFNIIAIVLGLFFWSLLIERFVTGFKKQIVLGFVIILQFLAWGVYSTIAMSWALTPALTLLMLRISKKERHSDRLLFISGLLVSLMVLLRYQNIILIPACGLFLLHYFRHDFKYLVKSGLLCMVPPTITYYLITYFNKINSGYSSFVSMHFKLDPTWHFRWITDVLRAFLLNSTRLDEIISSLFKKLNPTFTDFFLSMLATVIFVFVLTKIKKKFFSDKNYNTLVIWFFTCFASLVGMLLYLAIAMNYLNLPIGRYYHFLTPLFTILFFAALKPMVLNKKAAFYLILLFCFICESLIGVYSAYRWNLAKEFAAKTDTVLNLVSSARASEPNTPIFVITDHLFGAFLIKQYLPTYSSSSTDGIFESEKNYFSEPTLLVIASDRSPLKPQYEGFKNLETLSKEYGLHRTSNNSIDIYYKKFKPGSMRSQKLN